MDLALKGKVAIITGAGQGLGRAIAQVFAEEGANVVIADIAEEQSVKAADEIGSLGVRVLWVKTDVASFSEVHTMITKSLDRFKKIDILVNNAGIAPKISDWEVYGSKIGAGGGIHLFSLICLAFLLLQESWRGVKNKSLSPWRMVFSGHSALVGMVSPSHQGPALLTPVSNLITCYP